MSNILEGKVAIVTGAGKGIGRAVAEDLAGAGATVVVSDIDAAAGEAVASAIGGSATAVACDVSSEDQVASLVEGTVEAHGKLDVMVANAGIASVNPIVQMPLEEWRKLMSVNLDGVFLCDKHAGLAMAASGGGSIINMASTTALKGAPAIAHYAAAKAAVLSLTKSLALELRALNIRVNAICPGFLDTDLVHDRAAELEAIIGMPLMDVVNAKQGRLGTAAEVGKVATFLASDRSSFSSGAPFVLDGGCLASLV